MCQYYPKIDHPKITNTCYGYQRLAPKASFARRDSHRSIAHVYTPIANISVCIWCVIQTVYCYLKHFLWHKTRANNTRNVDNCLGLCTVGPNYETIIVSNQPLVYQTIPTKGFRSQEGVSRSQSGFPATAWAWISRKKCTKSSKMMHFLF